MSDLTMLTVDLLLQGTEYTTTSIAVIALSKRVNRADIYLLAIFTLMKPLESSRMFIVNHFCVPKIP